jgi:polyhydroxybutyrate depolymerase
MKRLAPLLLLCACGGGDDGGPDELPGTVYGGDRAVELQLPADFDPSQEYPLVLLLHGYSANGLLQTAYLGLGDVAVDPGVFFLAPDGVDDAAGNPHWNASPACCGDPEHHVDDVAYLGGLLDDVTADWPVDPSRVFVMGHSNGHFMSYRMACERADIITAIAGLAGAATSLDGVGCDPVAAVSSLHVHGDADATVSYLGGGDLNAEYPGAVESTMQIAAKNGCGDTRTDGPAIDLVRDLDGAETTTQLVDGCPDGVGVELWTIVGGGHIPNFVDGGGVSIIDWLIAHPRT